MRTITKTFPIELVELNLQEFEVFKKIIGSLSEIKAIEIFDLDEFEWQIVKSWFGSLGI